MITRLLFAAVALMTLTPLAPAASFDCRNAASTPEKLICQNPLLSQLDDDLAEQWNRARQQLTPYEQSQPHQQALNQLQRSWLGTRDQCQSDDCLRQRYQQQLGRLQYLNQVAQHALPTPIQPIDNARCFHGSFRYDVYLHDLTKEEYQQLGSYFQEMYDQKAPYHAIHLDIKQDRGRVSGNIAIAFRYANRLDDGEFSARQMTDNQAIGRRESSFGGSSKLLFTCVGDDQLRVSTFDSKGESYLFSMVMTRSAP